MADFPAPTRREKTAYRTAEPAATTPVEKGKEPVVVQRAEAPPEEPNPAPRAVKARPNLSKEEMAALLAVTETNRLTQWAKVGIRVKRAILPVGLLSTLFGVVLGTWASLIPIVIGIAYSSWPLVTQKKQGWT